MDATTLAGFDMRARTAGSSRKLAVAIICAAAVAVAILTTTPATASASLPGWAYKASWNRHFDGFRFGWQNNGWSNQDYFWLSVSDAKLSSLGASFVGRYGCGALAEDPLAVGACKSVVAYVSRKISGEYETDVLVVNYYPFRAYGHRLVWSN
jgi:hypothetical protein